MNKKRVFIIAEAGSNWRMGSPTRDLKMAKALIDTAADAGADAVKFQTFKAETVYVSNAGTSDYLSNAGIKESIVEIFQELSMPNELIPELFNHCEERKIQFMSSAFSVEDAKVLDPYVKIHKIASYEISHIRLIEFLASTGKPLILSTGAATLDDIKWAVNHFHQKGGKLISLLQTTARYPAPLSTLNLRSITTLKKLFDVPVGFSDHSLEPIIGPVAAVALGAMIIEKHFTLHKKLPGPDHSFALSPVQLKNMIVAVRKCEESLGDGEKIVLDEEVELRDFAQRSVQAITPIEKGDILKEGVNIGIFRPGKQRKGTHPQFLPEIENKKSRRNIDVGDGIMQNDYE